MKRISRKLQGLIPLLFLLCCVGVLFLCHGLAVGMDALQVTSGLDSLMVLLRAIPKKRLLISVLFVILSYALAYRMKPRGKTMPDFLFQNRFWICGMLFVLLVAFQIHGSSIGMYSHALDTMGFIGDGTLLGIPRGIRTDEYALFTPYAIAQGADPSGAYPYFSSIIVEPGTDMFVVYGQPVWDIAMVFRPFQLGYLLLGPERGLSFYWCGRTIALFLITLELLLLITDGKRRLSLLGALLVTLAPTVQWWFSINGLVEMLVFGQWFVCLLACYMRRAQWVSRALCLLGMVVCAGGYVLSLYPAWMVPLAYVFLVLVLFVMAKEWRHCIMTPRDWVMVAGALAVLVGLLGRILVKSEVAIRAVMSSAYPGNRAFTGGGGIQAYGNYLMNLFQPYKVKGLMPNQCEVAAFISFYPVGVIMAVYVMIRQKKADVLLIAGLALDVVFLLWNAVGFPEMLAKITLFSHAPPGRVMQVMGFLHILLLLRALSLVQMPLPIKGAIPLGVGALCGMLALCLKQHEAYLSVWMGILMVLVYLPLFLGLLQGKRGRLSRWCSGLVVVVMLVSGGMVNPIAKGMDTVFQQPLYQEILAIEKAAPGRWFVTAHSLLKHFPVMAGAATLNATQTYPHNALWEALDEDQTQGFIYNRYAHISGAVKEHGDDPTFVLRSADAFALHLTPKQLVDLDIRYLLSQEDVSLLSDEAYQFVPLTDGSQPYMVFELVAQP